MERVSVSYGDLPILLIAPHGVDDYNTDYIVDKIAHDMSVFSVINRGWKRSKSVDYLNDKANCNNISHIYEDVVKEEFLDPIIRIIAKIQKTLDEKIFIFNIHGCSNEVRENANDKNLDIILGCGDIESKTCENKIKNAFAYFLEKESFGVYEGKKSGKYSGSSKKNLNKLFNKLYPKENINCIQIEIVKELRETDLIDITSESLINALDEIIMFDDTTKIPPIKLKKI